MPVSEVSNFKAIFCIFLLVVKAVFHIYTDIFNVNRLCQKHLVCRNISFRLDVIFLWHTHRKKSLGFLGECDFFFFPLRNAIKVLFLKVWSVQVWLVHSVSLSQAYMKGLFYIKNLYWWWWWWWWNSQESNITLRMLSF